MQIRDTRQAWNAPRVVTGPARSSHQSRRLWISALDPRPRYSTGTCHGSGIWGLIIDEEAVETRSSTGSPAGSGWHVIDTLASTRPRLDGVLETALSQTWKPLRPGSTTVVSRRASPCLGFKNSPSPAYHASTLWMGNGRLVDAERDAGDASELGRKDYVMRSFMSPSVEQVR